MSRDKIVSIVVDSAASLPCDFNSIKMIQVVPMKLVIGSESFRDGIDIDISDLYKSKHQLGTHTTTSAPSPMDYMDAFKKAAEYSSSILCITVSSHFSASYKSAMLAADKASDEIESTRVLVLDSGSAAGGQGLVVTRAYNSAQSGHDLDHVVSVAKNVINQVSLVAFLDSLYHVWKSGRVPGLVYFGTSILDIKPMFELRQGRIRNIGRPRTYNRASKRLIEIIRSSVRDAPGPLHASVMHAGDPDGADRIREDLRNEFEIEELFISEFSAVMGLHTGPGLVGVAYWV